MTTTETIVELNGLIQTCRDGELGYGAAAADVRDAKLETVFVGYAKQRGQFVRNLQAEVKRLGGDPERSGSAGGTLLRGWIDLKTTLARGSGAAVIATCETGEEVAVAAFAWVVSLDISGQTRTLVEKQGKSVREAYARLLRLKAADSDDAMFQKNGREQPTETRTKRKNMKTFKTCGALLAVAIVGTLAGCSTSSTKLPDVSDSIRTSLDSAGLKDVSVTQDREKGVVTLGGHVASDGDKAQAESIARSFAGGEVVANQIGVLSPGSESKAAKINSDLDKGIEGNLDAALLKDRLHESVKYAVKNHVVTLTGEVDSQKKRARAEEVASAVLNVHQVVNELQVKAQKASSSN